MTIDYLNLSTMIDRVGRFVGNTIRRADDLIRERINTDYWNISNKYRWPALMRGSENTLTFTAGEKFLYLPKDVNELYFIIRGSPLGETPHQTIEKFFLRQLETVDTAGRFVTWSDVGEYGRRRSLPDGGCKVTVQNVGASVSDQQTVLVQGLIDFSGDKIEYVDTISITGSTAQDSAVTFADVIQVTTSGTQEGVILVTQQGDSSVVFATVEPNEVTARYKVLRLGYVPDGSSSGYTIYYKKTLRALVNDNDVPELPIANVLIEMAIAAMFAQERKWSGAASYHQALANEYLDNIISKVETQPARVRQAIPIVANRGRYNNRDDVIVVSN